MRNIVAKFADDGRTVTYQWESPSTSGREQTAKLEQEEASSRSDDTLEH